MNSSTGIPIPNKTNIHIGGGDDDRKAIVDHLKSYYPEKSDSDLNKFHDKILHPIFEALKASERSKYKSYLSMLSTSTWDKDALTFALKSTLSYHLKEYQQSIQYGHALMALKDTSDIGIWAQSLVSHNLAQAYAILNDYEKVVPALEDCINLNLEHPEVLIFDVSAGAEIAALFIKSLDGQSITKNSENKNTDGKTNSIEGNDNTRLEDLNKKIAAIAKEITPQTVHDTILAPLYASRALFRLQTAPTADAIQQSITDFTFAIWLQKNRIGKHAPNALRTYYEHRRDTLLMMLTCCGTNNIETIFRDHYFLLKCTSHLKKQITHDDFITDLQTLIDGTNKDITDPAKQSLKQQKLENFNALLKKVKSIDMASLRASNPIRISFPESTVKGMVDSFAKKNSGNKHAAAFIKKIEDACFAGDIKNILSTISEAEAASCHLDINTLLVRTQLYFCNYTYDEALHNAKLVIATASPKSIYGLYWAAKICIEQDNYKDALNFLLQIIELQLYDSKSRFDEEKEAEVFYMTSSIINKIGSPYLQTAALHLLEDQVFDFSEEKFNNQNEFNEYTFYLHFSTWIFLCNQVEHTQNNHFLKTLYKKLHDAYLKKGDYRHALEALSQAIHFCKVKEEKESYQKKLEFCEKKLFEDEKKSKTQEEKAQQQAKQAIDNTKKQFKNTILELRSAFKAAGIANSYAVGGIVRGLAYSKHIAAGADLDLVIGNIVVSGEKERPPTLQDLQKTFPNTNVTQSPHNANLFNLTLNNQKIDIYYSKHLTNDNDLTADAGERDFTVCALYSEGQGEYKDPTGRGISDLSKGIIQTIKPADQSFSEDPIRMLRAIYFAAKYDLKLSDEVKKALKNDSNLKALEKLKNSNPGHINSWLLKLFSLKNADTLFQLLFVDHKEILETLLPELAQFFSDKNYLTHIQNILKIESKFSTHALDRVYDQLLEGMPVEKNEKSNMIIEFKKNSLLKACFHRQSNSPGSRANSLSTNPYQFYSPRSPKFDKSKSSPQHRVAVEEVGLQNDGFHLHS